MANTLTPNQKLHALSAKYYQHTVWIPKKGDYYTSTRADLELYQIVNIKNGIVYTIYCNMECKPVQWDEKTFLTEGFGVNRVHVPDWIIQMEHVTFNTNKILVKLLPGKISCSTYTEEQLLDFPTAESLYEIRALRAAIDYSGKIFSVESDHIKDDQLYIESHEIWLRPNTWEIVT